MDVDSDMSNVAVGQFDGAVRILGSYNGNVEKILFSEDMESPATCLRWRPKIIEGSKFKSIISLVRSNGVIEHFDTKTKKVLNSDESHSLTGNHLSCLDYTADSESYLVGGKDKNIYMYDADTHNIKSTFLHDQMKVMNFGRITCIKTHKEDSNLFVVGLMNHQIMLYDVR
jgi:WD40 repeat protein